MLTAQTTPGCSSLKHIPNFIYLSLLTLADIDSMHNVDIERGQRAANWRLILRGSAFRTACSVVLVAPCPKCQGTITSNQVYGGDKEQDESGSKEHLDSNDDNVIYSDSGWYFQRA